jgi:hypothetical protein
MNKIEKLHLEAIESSYHTVYRNMNEVEEVDNELGACKSAEITENIALAFCEWAETSKEASDFWKKK